jgi:hypothetical protein
MELSMKRLFILVVIVAFGVTGALPFATIADSSNADAAQTTGKLKKKHGYSAQTTGKKHSKSKMKRASHQM